MAHRSAPGSQRAAATVGCLDDASLVNIFRFLTPLPDLFAAAAVCRRWRLVAADKRLQLVVGALDEAADAAAPLPLPLPWGARHSNRHATLAAAVAASAPGQSILLEPGAHAAADVHIRWPLSIAGAPGCVLRVPPGCARGVSVHAHCRLLELEVSASGVGACVEHAAGRLLVERCTLRCGEHPLAHLGAPLLARARAGGAVLSVVDSRCEGGAAAVRLAAGGRLARVRVIYLARAAAFWFDVLPGDDDDDAGGGAAAADDEPKATLLLQPDALPPLPTPCHAAERVRAAA